MSAWYYTFGPEHTLPFATTEPVEPQDAYVFVDVPEFMNPRDMVIGAFRARVGGDEVPAYDLFAGEYSSQHDLDIVDRIVMNKRCVGVISLEATCLKCEFAQSDCRCLIEEEI